MIFVVRELAFHEGFARRLSVIRKVEEVNHVGLLLLHCLPAEVNDAPEAEDFMVLLPTVSDKDRICFWERYQLKL